MHTSKKFKAKLKSWKKRGLTVKYLPTYSPELNLIEIVWRFIKYLWLPLSAYSSFKNLNAWRAGKLGGDGNYLDCVTVAGPANHAKGKRNRGKI